MTVRESLSATERHIRAIEGIYYRRDRSLTTGRNAAATDDTLEWHWRNLAAALEAGGFEELDARDSLARRYSRIERRRVGL